MIILPINSLSTLLLFPSCPIQAHPLPYPYSYSRLVGMGLVWIEEIRVWMGWIILLGIIKVMTQPIHTTPTTISAHLLFPFLTLVFGVGFGVGYGPDGGE